MTKKPSGTSTTPSKSDSSEPKKTLFYGQPKSDSDEDLRSFSEDLADQIIASLKANADAKAKKD